MSRPTSRPVTRGGEAGLAVVLAALWALLIVYASLYPFGGWRVPPGVEWVDLVRLRWTKWIPGFDLNSNLFGYLPLGLLWTLAGLAAGRSRLAAVATAMLIAAGLSYAMEVTQHFLPRRVPSALDWTMNVAGAALGAALALAVDALGWPARWRWLHGRWLERGGGTASALLLLWPVALLFPTPLPFGVGQVGGRLREIAAASLEGAGWAEPLRDWLESISIFERASTAVEWAVAALGLLAPCLVAYAASSPGWRRTGFAFGLPLVGAIAVTVSTGLNFGPENALAWRTPVVLWALALAPVIGVGLAGIGPRLAGALGLVVLTALVVLVHHAPPDPYFAQSLRAWEQGRFIRFHGLAEWIGWLWPYAAIGWLLARAARPA